MYWFIVFGVLAFIGLVGTIITVVVDKNTYKDVDIPRMIFGLILITFVVVLTILISCHFCCKFSSSVEVDGLLKQKESIEEVLNGNSELYTTNKSIILQEVNEYNSRVIELQGRYKSNWNNLGISKRVMELETIDLSEY
jgi:asparagine N-glycosylation enzyme membrane subunit Stt3